MTTVLITGIGGDIAQSVATIIREAAGEGYRLIGTDTHDQHGGSLFVHAYRPLVPANDPRYVTALLTLVAKEAVDVVIPMSEPELDVLSDVIGEESRVAWITAGTEAIRVGVDKLATAEALARYRVLAPWTRAVSAGAPMAYPCIVKTRRGSGSRSVFQARDRREAEYLASLYPDAVYQEYLEAHRGEVTCAVYRTLDGRVAVLQLLRRLVGGFTGWAEVIHDSAIEELCTCIAEGVNLRGSMNVQLRRTAAGPRVFEINPRFSSTVLMRHRIGFCDVIWSLQETAGVRVEPPSIPLGTRVVRTQGAAIVTDKVTS